MATKDISDRDVCFACLATHARGFNLSRTMTSLEYLVSETGQPEKVCYRALERAEKRGLIDCGTSVRTAWLTDKGKELLKSNSPSGDPRTAFPSLDLKSAGLS